MTPDPDIEFWLEEQVTAIEFAKNITDALKQITLTRKSRKEWLEKHIVIDSAGIPHWAVDTSGKGPVIDSDSVALLGTIDADTGNIQLDTTTIISDLIAKSFLMFNSNPLAFDAEGVAISVASLKPFYPITPVTVAANVNGLPATTEIVTAPGAGNKLDLIMFMIPDLTGNYTLRIHEDSGGAPSQTIPDLRATVIPLVLNMTFPPFIYGLRIKNVTANVNIGIANGVNGDWPNNSSMRYFGMYRRV